MKWTKYALSMLLVGMIGGALYCLYYWAPAPKPFNFLVVAMPFMALVAVVWNAYRDVRTPLPVLGVTFAQGASNAIIQPIFHGCSLTTMEFEQEIAQQAFNLFPDVNSWISMIKAPLHPSPEDWRKYFEEWVRYKTALDSCCRVQFEVHNTGKATAFSADIVITFPADWELLSGKPTPPDQPGFLLNNPVVEQTKILVELLAERTRPGMPEVRLDSTKRQVHVRLSLVNPGTPPSELPIIYVRPPRRHYEYPVEVWYTTSCPGPSWRGVIRNQGKLSLTVRPRCYDNLDALIQDFVKKHPDAFPNG